MSDISSGPNSSRRRSASLSPSARDRDDSAQGDHTQSNYDTEDYKSLMIKIQNFYPGIQDAKEVDIVLTALKESIEIAAQGDDTSMSIADVKAFVTKRGARMTEAAQALEAKTVFDRQLHDFNAALVDAKVDTATLGVKQPRSQEELDEVLDRLRDQATDEYLRSHKCVYDELMQRARSAEDEQAWIEVEILEQINPGVDIFTIVSHRLLDKGPKVEEPLVGRPSFASGMPETCMLMCRIWPRILSLTTAKTAQ